MNILLDTHAFLWWVMDDSQLSNTKKAIIASLPDHHRDPFDRLLIAQSQVENIPLLTVDHLISQYSVNVIW